MNTTKEYLNAMNHLDEQLDPDDKIFFKNLRAYMSTASFFKDEQAINEQIYQMYLDFLNAENEGFTAEEFFGNDPKEMADQLLEQLPKTSFKKLMSYVGIAAIMLWNIRLIFNFSDSIEVIINPALYFFDLILVFSLITLLFKLIQSSVYKKTTHKINFIEGIGAGLIFIFYIVVYLKAEQFIPETLAFTIPYPWDIILISGFILAAVIWTIKSKEIAFYGPALLLIILSLNGISLRLEAYTDVSIPFVFKILTLVGLSMLFIFVIRKLNKN